MHSGVYRAGRASVRHHVQMGIATEPSRYVREDGTLDRPKRLDSFATFWQRHGEVLLRGMPYHEADPTY